MWDSVRIGVVVPRTGRLTPLGAPVEFVAGRVAQRVRHVVNHGHRYPVEVIARDSGSTPLGAGRAVEHLVVRDRVHVVVSLGGSAALPAVVRACERSRVPCVSTTLPWQLFQEARGAAGEWSFHFAWGLGDIARSFAEMWAQFAPEAIVGCLWNNGTQGAALRKPEWGFLPTAARHGHHLVHEPAYTETTVDFGAQIRAFRDADVITSAATAADLATFVSQARHCGSPPRLITCSRWLTYPFGVRRHNLDRVATAVSWTPTHPYRSTVDGSSAADLAEDYEQATGRQWLQPLGLAHALFEVALHAVGRADDPTDRAALAQALRTTRIATIAGVLDWPGGPAPGVAAVPLAGGQWRAGARPHLVVVANSATPDVPLGGELS